MVMVMVIRRTAPIIRAITITTITERDDMGKLTDKTIKAAKSKAKLYKLSDGDSLYMVVTPRGSKLWWFGYRFDGKQQTLSLGMYGTEADGGVTLTKARDLAVDARRLVRSGINPSEKRKTEKAAEAATETAQAQRRTFKDAADGWRAMIDKKPRAPKTRERDERMIRYLTDAFGSKAINDVEPQDLIAVLDAYEDAESYETRMRLQGTALNIAGWAQGKAWIKTNPFIGIGFGKAFTAPTNVPRPALVEAVQFGQLLRDLAAYKGRQGNLVGKALGLLALTFVRPGTVTAAEWADFDLDGALWTIPFAKLKQRTFREGIKELRDKPHLVPLSRQAVALLRDLKKITGDGPYLFPGRKGRPISTNALETALNVLEYQGRHCPHGFRSSASTMLNAAKRKVGDEELPRFAEQAIEFQLEHVDESTRPSTTAIRAWQSEPSRCSFGPTASMRCAARTSWR
jgi:integrase